MKALCGLALALLLGACGEAGDGGGEDLASKEMRPYAAPVAAPTISPDPSPPVASCSQLLADGWEPSIGLDFDVSSNRSSGIAEFTFDDESLRLDIRNDPACRRLPTIGPVIARMLGEPEPTPVSVDLRRIGELFVDFARSADPDHYGPPADTPIELFVGGVLQTVVPSTRIPDRDAWQTCPGGIGYAARSCPISPLTPLEEYPGPIAMTAEPPAHVCAHPTELPERLDVYRAVTLAADETLDCTSYFGVQLFVNDVSQIVAVNLVLSEP